MKWDIISYPLVADADTGIHPQAASKAKRGIVMLSVDQFPYRGSKQGVTNLSHAQWMYVQFWNVSAVLKISDTFYLAQNHRINTALLARIAAARKVDGGRDRHCGVIADVPFSLYFTLMTSNVKYVYILHGC